MTRRPPQRTPTTDGRLLRSERSREQIVDALYELIGEGHMQPTAQQVAERSGVALRSVFRLFSDMDALYATTVAENDAVKRGLRELADEIRLRLAVYFAEARTAKTP